MTDWLETPEPGIYPASKVSAKEYHRWDAMSNSWLKVLVQTCPWQFAYDREHPRKSTAALEFGSMLHCLILEPFDFARHFAVEPQCDGRTREGKAIREKFAETRGDRIVVKEADYETARAMAHSMREHEVAWPILAAAEREVSIVWDDPDLGIRCKARLDVLNKADIVDLKSTINVNPDAFAYSIYNYCYHTQAAFYTDGIRAVLGIEPTFWFAAIQKTPPHIPIFRPAGETVLRGGRVAYKTALVKIKQCRESGIWPGYDETPAHCNETLELPMFAIRELGLDGRIQL